MHMKNDKSMIVGLPQKTLFTRAEVAAILSIGLSTLDSCISEEELPRERLSKRVLISRGDLEVYILQEINNHPVRFWECTITFTFHDGRLQFYTVQTSERKNVADIKSNFGETNYQNGKSA